MTLLSFIKIIMVMMPVVCSVLLLDYFIDGVLKYRFKNRKLVYIMSMAVSLSMAVMAILTRAADNTVVIDAKEGFTVILYVALAILLVAELSGKIWRRIVVVLLSLGIIASFDEIFTYLREIVYSILSPDNALSWVRLGIYLTFDILALALEVVFFIAIDRVRGEKDNVPLPISVLLLMFFLLSIFSSIFSVVSYDERGDGYVTDFSLIDNQRKLTLIITMLLGLFSVFIFFYIRVTRKERNDLRELNTVNEELISEQTRYFEAAAKADTEVRGMRHDMKNNIQVMMLLLESREYDKLRDYLQEMGDNMQNAEVSAHTGDTIADAIISTKTSEASGKGITLKTVGSFSGMKISPQDMCKILANLLDNAIEAASDEALKDLDNDMKKVELDLKKTDKFFMISVTNPCAKEPLTEDGEMKTIKSDKKNHGFGIKNIKSAAENYGGELSYSTEARPYGCIVRSEVLFPLTVQDETLE